MKVKKPNRYIRAGALVLMPVYLFIAAVHLFFAPKFQSQFNTTVLKKNTEAVYYLIRNDRSTYNENKQAKTTAKSKTVFSISLLTSANPAAAKSVVNACCSQFISHYPPALLSNCVLRL
jgi:hypothetical protein